MSVQLTPAKRPYDRSHKDRNGKGKLQKSSAFNSQLKVSPGSTIFRVLCPGSKIGSVIGKGGSIISQIREETGAKVRVEETLPGSDERVIFIISSDKDSEVAAEGSKEDADEIKAKEEGDKASGEEDDDQKFNPVEDLRSEKGKPSAQKALLLVFEKIVEGESEKNGGDEENKSTNFVIRLLVLSSQVGCLLGRGGSVIKQMSSDSGAQIRVLPRDKAPPSISPDDELVQISGEVDAVRSALQTVSQQLLENPPRVQDSIFTNPNGPSSRSFGNPLSKPEAYPENYHFPAQGATYAAGPPMSRLNDRGIPGRMNPPNDIVTFRMLCHEERVGGVIGKAASIVKTLQFETGCDIKVLERISGSEDRLIVISGSAHPDERISAPQDAVLRVQTRIFRAIPESKENTVPAKLLVSSNQIGCLLGKGGNIIAEMRKASGAHIRILGKDQLPNCASEDEEVVQINGEFNAVQDALMHITTRLRNHFFRNAFPSNPAFPDQAPPFPSYPGRRELSPPGMHSNLGPPFHKFDGVGGPPPHGGFHPLDDRIPFMHRPGAPPHISERKPSSAWAPQGLHESGGPLGLPDYAGVPQRRVGGFGGGSHHAIITNISVEVVVPRSCVAAIYGEDGGCLKQIREFSDAKITINDLKPGAAETLIMISGTPEQTHAAQSLIQAFVMIETQAS